MRVILENTQNTSLPSQNDGYVAPATPVTSTLTQVGLWEEEGTTVSHKYYPENGSWSEQTWGKTANFATGHVNGMCYVIRLEDGSFIVVDGGHATDKQADNLYKTLEKQAEGKEVVIAAWIFTHAHEDHVGAFKKFTEKYHTMVTVESFIYNFPTEKAATANKVTSPKLDAITEAMVIYPEAKTIIAHAGQVHYIRNAVVNILYTYDMMMPYKMVDYNASSVVFNVELEGSTILFLGDASGESDNVDGELSYMADIYSKDTLGANIVQATHHGIDRHEKVKEFYSMIKDDVKYLLVPAADRYIVDGENYYDIGDRAALITLTKANAYYAGYSATILTLSDGAISISAAPIDNYVNS